MADADNSWQKAIETCRRARLGVIPLDSPESIDSLRASDWGTLPGSFVAFAQAWHEMQQEPWQALVQSVLQTNPNTPLQALESRSVRTLHRVLSRADRAAITIGDPLQYRSPNPWALLLQIRASREDADPGYLLLHPPIQRHELQPVQQVLGIELPPSYADLLVVSNGIGLDPTGSTELFGAGAQRANWALVVNGPWLQCTPFHEITAQWRLFHGVYEYEHERDAQEGVTTFRSDEHAFVPFLETNVGDSWCFDTAHQERPGEYNVIFWDHELRGVTDRAASFADWVSTHLEGLIFEE